MKKKYYTSKLYPSWEEAEETRLDLEKNYYGRFVIKGQGGAYTVIPRKHLETEAVQIILWKKGTK